MNYHILEYASEIWGYKENIECERIHHQRANRYYMGIHPKTPILTLIGDMGWLTSQIKRHRNMIRCRNRFINMNDKRLTKQVFIYDISKGNSSWSSEVITIIQQNGTDTTQSGRDTTQSGTDTTQSWTDTTQWDRHYTEWDRHYTMGQTLYRVGQTPHRVGQTLHSVGQTLLIVGQTLLSKRNLHK